MRKTDSDPLKYAEHGVVSWPQYRIAIEVCEAADTLYEALWDSAIWQDPKFKAIHDAMREVDIALQELERSDNYVRVENRSDG